MRPRGVAVTAVLTASALLSGTATAQTNPGPTPSPTAPPLLSTGSPTAWQNTGGNTVTVGAQNGPSNPPSAGGHGGTSGARGGTSDCTWTPSGGQDSISGYDPAGNIISGGGGYDSNGKLISPGTPGTWFVENCNGQFVSVTFVPTGSSPTGPSVSPATLAAQARSQLVAPAPGVQMSPPTTHWQYVNVPTWAWLTAAQWVPLHATAAVPGVSVTATATPIQLVFSYEDGLGATKTVTCNGHGTAYSDQLANAEFAAMPDPKPGLTPLVAPSPDCGWTWKHSSAGSPDEKLEIAAHVVYDLTWAVTGAAGGGSLSPLNSATTTLRLTVGEIEALNTK